jgi:hypothetical protein
MNRTWDGIKPVSKWPVTFKAPALVALFMIAVSLLVAHRR